MTLCDTKPRPLQNRSLLLTLEHLTNNIVNVRCYVLNQTTVVPKCYVHMTNVSITFCYTDSFIGNQTYAPMLNYSCVYVKCTSFKAVCVRTWRVVQSYCMQWLRIIFSGVRLCSFKLFATFSLAHANHLLILWCEYSFLVI